MSAANVTRPSSMLLDALVATTIASLFCGINERVGGIKIQLSDLFVAISVFALVLRGFAKPRVSQIVSVALAGYLLIFCVSAFRTGVVSGLRECIQVALYFSFLFSLFGYYRTHCTSRVMKLTAGFIALVLLFNVGWHVANGFYVSWKRLNEPKTIFILLPLLLIMLFDRFGRDRRGWFLAAALVSTLVIVLSGERKAWLFGIAALVIWLSMWRWRYLALITMAAPLLIAIASIDSTGYLSRQFGSYSTALSDRIERASTSELFDVGRAGTFSDSQREFTRRLATQMWRKEPIFGMGTGAYVEAMKHYTALPGAFRVGIHGEFHRALFENGIVGLSSYIAYWVAVTFAIGFGWRAASSQGDRALIRIKTLFALMAFIYCAFEASKGLTIAALCALPFVVSVEPRRRERNTAFIQRPVLANR